MGQPILKASNDLDDLGVALWLRKPAYIRLCKGWWTSFIYQVVQPPSSSSTNRALQTSVSETCRKPPRMGNQSRWTYHRIKLVSLQWPSMIIVAALISSWKLSPLPKYFQDGNCSKLPQNWIHWAWVKIISFINPQNGSCTLVGGFKHFLFFHILGIIIPTD